MIQIENGQLIWKYEHLEICRIKKTSISIQNMK